ncbi:MAG: type 4a pilus biogenesis protein PilO, partial [candidate division NC10 bacterium]|nr:type 4a pilus biogenesis protein PilO [candidate division NC10 bacterium]
GARGTIEAADRLRRELEVAQIKARRLDEKILSRRNFTRILEQLAESTREYNIRIVSMKPMEEERPNPDAPYQPLPIEMDIRCRYLDLGRYLEDLGNRPLLLHVESLQIRADEKESPTLAVHLVLTAYAWRGRERKSE